MNFSDIAVISFFSSGFIMFVCSLIIIRQKNIIPIIKYGFFSLFVLLGFVFMNQGGICLENNFRAFRMLSIFWTYLATIISMIIVMFVTQINKACKD